MLAFWRGFDQPTAMLSTVKMLPDKVDPSVVCIGEDLLGGGNSNQGHSRWKGLHNNSILYNQNQETALINRYNIPQAC
jgi:hypothetical protein